MVEDLGCREIEFEEIDLRVLGWFWKGGEDERMMEKDSINDCQGKNTRVEMMIRVEMIGLTGNLAAMVLVSPNSIKALIQICCV